MGKTGNRVDRSIKKEDRKMLAKVMAEFFLVLWGCIFLIGIIHSVSRYGLDMGWERLPKTAGITAIVSAVCTPLSFVFIKAYAKAGKDRGSRLEKIKREHGTASREAYDFCMECFNHYAPRPNQKNTAASWAMQAAAVCVNGRDAAEARRCLGLADMSGFFDSPEDKYNLLNIISYFQLLIGIDILEKNTEAADSDYAAAKPYFNEIKEGDGRYIHVQTTVCDYLAFKGKTEEALRRLFILLGELEDSEMNELKSAVNANIGEIYWKTGRREEGDEYFKKALEYYPEECRWEFAQRIEIVKRET
ncbi:MAG: tetratricopeptide repeat protein [Ruminococcus sp.]|nr:tetratricopeptide repeat protein [Ruminococcus sp.]